MQPVYGKAGIWIQFCLAQKSAFGYFSLFYFSLFPIVSNSPRVELTLWKPLASAS